MLDPLSFPKPKLRVNLFAPSKALRCVYLVQMTSHVHLGARQVGKSTLARQFARRTRGRVTFFDLERPEDLARLAEPMLALEDLRGLVILDEVQRFPDILPVLRVLADRPRRPCRFLVLGSASASLLRQSSESLAGRVGYLTLEGFSLAEVGTRNLGRLWLRGAFPRSYLARTNEESLEWRRNFLATFLERDLPQLGFPLSAVTLRRFWSMLAHWHGQVWNSSEFARSFGVADTTVRRYLDVLTGAFMVRQLLPWHANLSKRQVKAPKIYLADAGLVHTFLGINTVADLEGHPEIGASWEGFALNAVVSRLRARSEECYFWATHAGAELDLLIVRGRERRGFEFKRTDSPRITPSMKIAMDDLKLQRLDIVHSGKKSFLLSKMVRAVALSRILDDLNG